MKLKPIALLTAGLLSSAGLTAAEPDLSSRHRSTTTTPIKHVIVVIGENVSFDTLYGAYVPPHGRSVMNLLSERIINADGTPGPRYGRAVQHLGGNRGSRYNVEPIQLEPYAQLPQPMLTGVFNPQTLQPFGLIPDPRFAALDLNGPFQITKFVAYGDAGSATGDPVHRFFQMWQQTAGSNEHLGLFTWVAATTGQGGDTVGVTQQNPGQGGELMGFFNMSSGDAPFFKELAENYALSDNYHQSVMGGTGANFISIATGDMAVYKLNGKKAVPPANQIENPDPLPTSVNFYAHDGYSGGSYVNCSDPAQPGVASILHELRENRRHSNCEKDAFYLVNNYDPPFTIDGTPKALGPDKFVYPPQNLPTIGEALAAKRVSWKWYTGGRDAADVVGDPLYAVIRAIVQAQVPPGTPAGVIDAIAFAQTQPLLYNNIGDPHNGSASVVGGPLRNNLKGLDTFYQDISGGTLPAVSFVIPKNLDSGHPGFSAPSRYELFLKDLLQRVQGNTALWEETAVLITTDEGGGYFDTGFIQNLDFFGDGPRIPFLVVSPFAKKGHVNHVYHDHASILKFIEHNWRLPPLSARSRDRLPNPIQFNRSYRPLNAPAVGDLMTMFNFFERDGGKDDKEDD